MSYVNVKIPPKSMLLSLKLEIEPLPSATPVPKFFVTPSWS